MATVSLHDAEHRLSELIEQVLAGEEVVIARDDLPVVRIVREAPPAPAKKPLLGAMKGRLIVDDSFFEPLSEDELALWYDGKI